MEILDNINRLLGDDLKQVIQPDSRLRITASGFSIYAFEARLCNELTQRAINKECAEGIWQKAIFRTNRSRAPMQQFVYESDSTKINVAQIFKLLSPETKATSL